jgi:hypothetical protein
LDKLPSFDAGETPRRSTSSLDVIISSSVNFVSLPLPRPARKCSLGSMPKYRRLYALALLLLVGCAATKPQEIALAPRYYGVWVNANPNYYNWWQISAAGAVNYGVALDGGKCTGRSATVLGANRIDIEFGNSGTAYLRLAEGDLLLFEAGPTKYSLHRRVEASNICRKSDGEYFEGAPYPAH